MPEKFGRLMFSQTGPAVRYEITGDIENGDIRARSTLRNTSRSTIGLRANLRVESADGAKEIIERLFPTRLAGGQDEDIEVKEEVSVSTPYKMRMVYEVTNESKNILLYRSEVPFTCHPSFKVEVIPIYGKDYINVEVDVRRLGGLPDKVEGYVALVKGRKEVERKEVKGLGKRRQGTVRMDIKGLEPSEYDLRTAVTDTRGKEMLRGPVRMEMKSKGNTLRWDEGKFIEEKPGKGGLRLQRQLWKNRGYG